MIAIGWKGLITKDQDTQVPQAITITGTQTGYIVPAVQEMRRCFAALHYIYCMQCTCTQYIVGYMSESIELSIHANTPP